MAGKEEMDYVYSLIDTIFRLSLGENGDFSGAMYNGEFSLSLEQAQEKKHRFIAENLRITKGTKVLDMGCGWGPLLHYLKGLGAKGIGLTLSTGQAESCRKSGLEVAIMDCPDHHATGIRNVRRGDQPRRIRAFLLGGRVAAGKAGRHLQRVLSHRCGPPARRRTTVPADHGLRQEHDRLPGRSTSTRNGIPRRTSWPTCAVNSPVRGSRKGTSRSRRMRRRISRTVFKSSGRLDYIETIRQWGRHYRSFNLKKYAFYLSLVPRWLGSRQLRERLSRDQLRSNILCFEREVLDHYRMVFEKK